MTQTWGQHSSIPSDPFAKGVLHRSPNRILNRWKEGMKNFWTPSTLLDESQGVQGPRVFFVPFAERRREMVKQYDMRCRLQGVTQWQSESVTGPLHKKLQENIIVVSERLRQGCRDRFVAPYILMLFVCLVSSRTQNLVSRSWFARRKASATFETDTKWICASCVPLCRLQIGKYDCGDVYGHGPRRIMQLEMAWRALTKSRHRAAVS